MQNLFEERDKEKQTAAQITKKNYIRPDKDACGAF